MENYDFLLISLPTDLLFNPALHLHWLFSSQIWSQITLKIFHLLPLKINFTDVEKVQWMNKVRYDHNKVILHFFFVGFFCQGDYWTIGFWLVVPWVWSCDQVLEQAWPFFGMYVEKLLRENIQPTVRISNSALKMFTFTKIHFGHKVSLIRKQV